MGPRTDQTAFETPSTVEAWSKHGQGYIQA